MEEQEPTPPPLIINSSALYLRSYKTFSKNLESFKDSRTSTTHHPEAFRTLGSNKNVCLPSFPKGFPIEKRIPQTTFVVDGFKHAGPHSVAYFLTHFHSDHYTGLNPHWSRGMIFCSHVTARLLINCLKVSEHFVVPFDIGEIVHLDGCQVTLVDANHCPGAVQILVKVFGSSDNVKKYVHTGDMRYDANMKFEPAIIDFIGANAVFLDTTYCNPKFEFPSQADSVEYVVTTIHGVMEQEKARNAGNENAAKSSVLILIAAYVIGKEKIFVEVSKRCNCKIYVEKSKLQFLRCLDFPDPDIFTVDSALSNVHVVGWNILGETHPYFKPNWVKMEKMMNEKGYKRVVGFVPTGWMYEVKKTSFPVRVKGCLEMHLVPYSEHSNYNELREYVEFLRPIKIVPSVGLEGLGLDSKQASVMLKCFANLVDETAQKRTFLKPFHRKAADAAKTVHEAVTEEEDNMVELCDIDIDGDDGVGCSDVGESLVEGCVGKSENADCSEQLNVVGRKDHDAELRDLSKMNSVSESQQEVVDKISGISSKFVPKAYFSRGSRKRNFSTVEHFSSLDNNHTAADNTGNIVSDNAKMAEAIVEASCTSVVSNEPDGISKKPKLEMAESPKEVAPADNLLEELKSCLPPWVTDDQLSYLISKSNHDITEAVSEFYEHETMFHKQVVSKPQNASPPEIVMRNDNTRSDNVSKPENSNAKAPLGRNTNVTINRSKIQGSSSKKYSPSSKKKSPGKNLTKKRSTQTKLSNWINSSDSGNKLGSGVSGKSKQSSITNFFSRTAANTEAMASQSEDIIATEQVTTNQRENITEPDMPPDYSERVNQLTQILGGSLSNEEALTLLEKVKGDVTVAVDVYYSSR